MSKSALQAMGKTVVRCGICFLLFPRTRRPEICLLLAFLAGIVMAGCSKPNVYIHPSPGLDRIKKMAVMPFDNLSKDSGAAEKVRTGFVIELLRTGSFNVIDANETDRILQEAGLSYSVSQSPVPSIRLPRAETEVETATSMPVSRRIGDALDVQAIIVGSVEVYNTERVGDQVNPEVSISVRLIDAETGIIIWASNHTRRGGIGVPILGWGKITSLSLLSQKVIQDMIGSLAEYVP